VILIAHRLATVARADLILVLHQGELVESGTHLQLMRKEGIYARLLKFQRSQEPDTARS
jgi:ABC-type multidrug transport system fused ATPase/permease subunit